VGCYERYTLDRTFDFKEERAVDFGKHDRPFRLQ
jgi:hypothetical protein